jgi:hypothetical protein
MLSIVELEEPEASRRCGSRLELEDRSRCFLLLLREDFDKERTSFGFWRMFARGVGDEAAFRTRSMNSWVDGSGL